MMKAVIRQSAASGPETDREVGADPDRRPPISTNPDPARMMISAWTVDGA